MYGGGQKPVEVDLVLVIQKVTIGQGSILGP